MRSTRSILCIVVPSCAIVLSQMILGTAAQADPPKAGARPRPVLRGNNPLNPNNRANQRLRENGAEATLDGNVGARPVRGANSMRRGVNGAGLPVNETRAQPTIDGGTGLRPVRGVANIHPGANRAALPTGQTRPQPTIDGGTALQPIRGQNNQRRGVNQAGLSTGEIRTQSAVNGRSNTLRESEVLVVRPSANAPRPTAATVAIPGAGTVKLPAYRAALDALIAAQEAMHNGSADLARTNLTNALTYLQKSRDRQEVHATRQDGINMMQNALRQMNQSNSYASLDDTTGRAIQDVRDCLAKLETL